MYFRNKFNEEFLYFANAITPKGGSVRLDSYPKYFIFERPAFDEEEMYVVVKPLLLYNKVYSSNPNDKNIEDWIMLCENKKDTRVSCTYDKNYFSNQTRLDEVKQCDLNYININSDLMDEEILEQYYSGIDYEYEDV